MKRQSLEPINSIGVKLRKTPKQILALLARAAPENRAALLKKYARASTRGLAAAKDPIAYLEKRLKGGIAPADALAKRLKRVTSERGLRRLSNEVGLSVDVLRAGRTKRGSQVLARALREDASKRPTVAYPSAQVSLPGIPELGIVSFPALERMAEYKDVSAYEVAYLDFSPQLEYVEIQILWQKGKRKPKQKDPSPSGVSPDSGLKEGSWTTKRVRSLQMGGIVEAASQVALRTAAGSLFTIRVREYSYPTARMKG